MKRPVPTPALAGAVAALLLAAPAQAQLATRSSAPVDITADELETLNGQCQAIWRGSAEALQDNARLRADVLRIFNKRGAPAAGTSKAPACGDLDRMEAEGSVYYVTPQQKVRANSAVYEAGSTTITMIGDVVAVQGQNVLRGDRMVFNTQTGQGQMQGGAQKGGKNRPRGVFYPSGATTASSPRQ
jgi:lipopolysaccharide export system protein LptA